MIKTAPITEEQMQHGIDWIGQDLSGWFLTEKFDGVRAYWDGADLYSRGGIKAKLPAEWAEAMPAGIHLDCELYFGPGGVYKCGAAMRFGKFLPGMSLIVFDAPQAGGDYEQRMAAASEAVAGLGFVSVAKVTRADKTQDAIALMTEVQARNGEGVMARHPDIRYHAGRTNHLLKVKTLAQ